MSEKLFPGQKLKLMHKAVETCGRNEKGIESLYKLMVRLLEEEPIDKPKKKKS